MAPDAWRRFAAELRKAGGGLASASFRLAVAAKVIAIALAVNSAWADTVIQTEAYTATRIRPNIVLILIDDLGWADLGCYGSTFHETPNVDRMAREGVRFTDAYAASPVCTPTRASILTGKYPSRIQMTNHSGTAGPRGLGYRLDAPVPVGSLPLEEVTLAEALKDAGYVTAHIGKWHLQGHNEKGTVHFPQAQGFDVNIGGHRAGQPASYFHPYRSKQLPGNDVPGLESGKPGEYLTDRLTDEAITFIRENKAHPFFVNIWYYTVHTPIQGKPAIVEEFSKKAAALGLSKMDNAVAEYHIWHNAVQNRPDYAAMVNSMDLNVGRILDALKAEGLDENTLIVFTSDNGGLSTGTGKRSPTSNLPLRAGKSWVYEGGIRVPLVVKGPGVVESRRDCGIPVISTDLYPTLLEMAGLSLRPQQHVDGISLAPLLKGDRFLDRDALFFHYPHYHPVNTMGPAGAVRVGDYKLVERYEDMTVELFNLYDDIGERNDLSAQMPELTQRLKVMLHRWRSDTGAMLPARNPNYSEAKDYRRKNE